MKNIFIILLLILFVAQNLFAGQPDLQSLTRNGIEVRNAIGLKEKIDSYKDSRALKAFLENPQGYFGIPLNSLKNKKKYSEFTLYELKIIGNILADLKISGLLDMLKQSKLLRSIELYIPGTDNTRTHNGRKIKAAAEYVRPSIFMFKDAFDSYAKSEDTIIHEIGHGYWAYLEEAKRDLLAEYKENFSKRNTDEFNTQYSQESYQEAFSEDLAAFVKSSVSFKNKSPINYLFFENLLHGQYSEVSKDPERFTFQGKCDEVANDGINWATFKPLHDFISTQNVKNNGKNYLHVRVNADSNDPYSAFGGEVCYFSKEDPNSTCRVQLRYDPADGCYEGEKEITSEKAGTYYCVSLRLYDKYFKQSTNIGFPYKLDSTIIAPSNITIVNDNDQTPPLFQFIRLNEGKISIEMPKTPQAKLIAYLRDEKPTKWRYADNPDHPDESTIILQLPIKSTRDITWASFQLLNPDTHETIAVHAKKENIKYDKNKQLAYITTYMPVTRQSGTWEITAMQFQDKNGNSQNYNLSTLLQNNNLNERLANLKQKLSFNFQSPLVPSTENDIVIKPSSIPPVLKNETWEQFNLQTNKKEQPQLRSFVEFSVTATDKYAIKGTGIEITVIDAKGEFHREFAIRDDHNPTLFVAKIYTGEYPTGTATIKRILATNVFNQTRNLDLTDTYFVVTQPTILKIADLPNKKIILQ